MSVPPELADMSLEHCVTIEDVRAAGGVLRGHARVTPVFTSGVIDDLAGARVYLKCENFQRVGAFKFRGAFHAMSRLGRGERGVLAYSSGNHAQAVACAAGELGVPALIVMPENAPRIKRLATEAYLSRAPAGSAVVEYDPAREAREELSARLAEELGLTIIPPYDHPDVIAGQGTAALELFEEVGALDALYVPCGGGGLLSGSGVVARSQAPSCRVVGVEPEAGDDAGRSFRARRLHTVRNPATIADGARTPYLGRHTFPLVLGHVDEFATVSDRELAAGMRLLLERLKILAEPTGVLGLAGLLAARKRGVSVGARVGVIVSGGNIDLHELPGVLALAE